MKSKLSRVSFFLYLFSYNYIWFRTLLFTYFYNQFESMAVFYALLLCLGVTFLIWMLPKKILQHDYTSAYQKSKTKYVYNIILAIESIIGIIYCAYILSSVFVQKSSPFAIMIVFALTVSVLSKLKTSDIVQISTLFYILGVLLSLFSFLFFISVDMTTLLPFKEKNWLALPIFVIIILGDNASVLLMDKESFIMSKPMFIFPIMLAILSFAFELLMLQSSAGTEVFKNLNWVGFICFSIQPITKYSSNFDYVYIYLLVISCIFKYAFNWGIIRNSFKKTNKNDFWKILIVLLVGIYTAYTFFFSNERAMWYVSILLGISVLMFVWMFKEVYHAAKARQ